MNRLVVFLAASIAFAALAQAPNRDALSANTAKATAAGVTFTAPKEWSVTPRDNLSILEAPHNVGLVILTNADGGYLLRGPLLRRTLEVMFDGRPEADATVAASAATIKAQEKKERERLTIPPDAAGASKLAARYSNRQLGTLRVIREGPQLVFDFGSWKSPMASRNNDDGTRSFVTIDPAITGVEFVVADRAGKKGLMLRDAQHEYLYSGS